MGDSRAIHWQLTLIPVARALDRIPGDGSSRLMMRRYFPSVILAFALPGVVRGDITSDLSAAQLQQVKSGQLVVTKKDMPGGVWPQLTVYTLVDAPIATIGDVFRDYAHAQDFQPNIVSAKVIAKPSANVYNVEYTQKLPLFGTTSFTVQNTYAQTPTSLDVTWTLLKSAMAEISDGSLRAEPFGDGSILRYTNYVKPKSAIAIVAKGAALGEVKNTVTALKDECEKRAK